ncbi:MAG TPA: N-acetylornithine carbamoyltransferase [Balneolales bacterium]|nr:N-acetylornithine carbamoyltransferase [Balneolales bacterium]
MNSTPSLTKKDFLYLSDWPTDELTSIIKLATDLKKNNYREHIAKDRVLGLFFNNPSLRTLISFQTAAAHLGAQSVVIQPGKSSWNIELEDGTIMDGDNQEHIKEMMQVLSNYVDTLGIRYFASFKDEEKDKNDTILKKMAGYASVPVINMESATAHPCQAMADWMTLIETMGPSLDDVNVVLTWAPHPHPLPRAVPQTTLEAFVRSGANVTLACPPEMMPDKPVLNNIKQYASSNLNITHKRDEALKNADIVYAKSWHAAPVYSNPDEEKKIRQQHKDWTLTAKDMAKTRSARFMHCLPIRRNVVAEDAVLDDPKAIHIEQAENRLHIQKAILMKLWNLSL